VTDPAPGELSYPRIERTGLLAMAAMRTELSRYAPRDRPVANRLVLDVTAPWTLPPQDRGPGPPLRPAGRRVPAWKSW
jgi:hypothetical protein